MSVNGGNLLNAEMNPGIRNYQTIKKSFRLEPYLYSVREVPFRSAIAQILASSLTLAECCRHPLDRKCQFKKDYASDVVLLKTRRILYYLVM